MLKLLLVLTIMPCRELCKAVIDIKVWPIIIIYMEAFSCQRNVSRKYPTWGELLIISSMKFLRLPLGVLISPRGYSPSNALSSDRQLVSKARWDPLDTLRAPLTCWLWDPAGWAWFRSAIPMTGADSRLLLSLSFTSPPPPEVGVAVLVLLFWKEAAGCSLPFDGVSLSMLAAKKLDAPVEPLDMFCCYCHPALTLYYGVVQS